jgi:hypothetical protein
MNGVDLSTGDIALVCQLVSAAALGVHLLVLRPRAARRDLTLEAQIVQDELELGVRLGQVSPVARETLALQQILRRIRYDPRSVGMVMDRITLLSQTAHERTPQTHIECIRGALDRVGDAGQRYLRGAWPRAGMPSPRPASRSYGLEEIEDLDDLDDVNTVDDRDRDGTADVVLDLADIDDIDHHVEHVAHRVDARRVDTQRVDAVVAADIVVSGNTLSAESSSPDDGAGSGISEQSNDFDDVKETAAEASDASADDDSGAEDEIDAEPREPVRSADEDDLRQTLAPDAANVDLTDDPDRTTAWVDLVQAENVGPVAGSPERPHRHSRPFRPGRSSSHIAERPVGQAEPLDRSTVLPR